jgi:hypothetical protein
MHFYRWPLLALLFAWILILSACKKETEIIDPFPNPSPGPVSGQLTDEKKMEVMEKVREKYQMLNWQKPMEARMQLLTFLLTVPEFEEAGLSLNGSNVWARFPDDELLIVAAYRKPAENPDNGRLSFEQEATQVANMGQLPGSDKVTLMNAMGNVFFSNRNNMDGLSALFHGKGYTVEKIKGSIENLKKVKDEGVFYFNTHGGSGKLKDGKQVYRLWTTDSATVSNNKKYATDLKKGNLCYMLAHHNYGPDRRPAAELHYAITGKFVEEYMSFASYALLYLDACSSFINTDFGFSFLKKTGHTGTYFGWTHDVGDETAYKTAKYVFDRLLGVNFEQPESPKQRAFDLKSVFADMMRKDIGVYHDREEGFTALLSYKESPGSNVLLMPTIAYMHVDELNDMLYIYGSFGDETSPGTHKVTINNQEVEIDVWTEGLIYCKIRPSGPGSAGDVVVHVGEHKSAPRRLTEWRGQINYTYQSEGSLKETITFKVHLRADVHHYRKDAGEKPVSIPMPDVLVPMQTIAKDSEAWYTIGGEGTSSSSTGPCSSNYKAQWAAGQGSIPFKKMPDATLAGKEFSVTAEFTGRVFHLDFFTAVEEVSTETLTVTTVCPDGDFTQSQSGKIGLGSIPAELKKITLVLDNNFNLQAGKKEVKMPGHGSLEYNAGAVPTFPVTMQWNKIQANFAPEANAAVRMGFE